MVEIIAERRRPSFSERLNVGVGRGIESGKELYQSHLENQALKKIGIDLSGIRDPELRKVLATAALKKQAESGQIDTYQKLLSKMSEQREEPTGETELSQGGKNENLDRVTDPFSKAKAAALSKLPSGIVNILSEEAKLKHREANLPKEQYIKQEYKSLPKFMEGVDATEDKIPVIDTSIKLAEEAIEDPGKWPAFRDLLADKTGYEGFRSARGAELQSAIKQYFLGDLSSIKGGRPNQLIEKQLLDAYPRIGRDPISNQKIISGMKMQRDIGQEKVRIARELEEKYLAEKGFLPPGFQSIVRQKLRPIVDKIEKNTINTLTKLSKYQKEYENMASKQLRAGEVLMLSPSGEYEAISRESVPQAKDQGYIKLKG